MTDHLSASILNALVDGELASEQQASVHAHLDLCPLCTAKALTQALLKNAVTRSGRRYGPSPAFENRMRDLISRQTEQPAPSSSKSSVPLRSKARLIGYAGWAAAAVLLVVLAGSLFLRSTGHATTNLAENTALVREISDVHVASLAVNQPPQVLSSDRHTVKPWFEGKIPFAFNLPENLPEDTKLEGANLAYLHGAPAAQLIYAIGRHRASIFVLEKGASGNADHLLTEHSGFQIAGFETAELDVIAITDADRSRLTNLVGAFEQAQTNGAASQSSQK